MFHHELGSWGVLNFYFVVSETRKLGTTELHPQLCLKCHNNLQCISRLRSRVLHTRLFCFIKENNLVQRQSPKTLQKNTVWSNAGVCIIYNPKSHFALNPAKQNSFRDTSVFDKYLKLQNTCVTDGPNQQKTGFTGSK